MKSIMALRFGSRVVSGVRYYFYELNRKRVGLGTDKSEAKTLFNEVRKQYLAGKLADIAGKCNTTLGEFKAEYIELMKDTTPRPTFRANRLALDKLIAIAGETTKLDKIGKKHIDKLAANHSGLSVYSVNNYIRHAKTVFNKAVDWGYLPSNPLSTVKQRKVNTTIPIFLVKEEIADLISKIKDVDVRRLVVAYLATGRRRSELLGLKWTGVDFDKGWYRVCTKGGREKSFPLNSLFRAVLLSLPRDGERVFSKWEHPDTITHIVKEALVAAGYGHMHLHHLRHTYASLKAGEGRSLKEMKELLGHSHINATMIYTHLTDNHLADIAEVFLGPVDLG